MDDELYRIVQESRVEYEDVGLMKTLHRVVQESKVGSLRVVLAHMPPLQLKGV